MAIPKIPKITWGASFANTWVFPTAPDFPLPMPDIRGGVFDNGAIRDRWITHDTHDLTIVVPNVPRLVSAGATGFSDVNGVYEALRWLMKGNQGRYYPDKDAGSFHTFDLIADPGIERQTPGGARYKIMLKMRDAAGAAFTDAY